MTSIELRCGICPQNPTFSDQSHLLTHIGSKGHLSHYFKAQVRSRQDPVTRDILLKYNAWYAESNIDKLLSQRLMTKELKRGEPKISLDGDIARCSASKKKPRKPRKAQEIAANDYSPKPGGDRFDSKLPNEDSPAYFGQGSIVSTASFESSGDRFDRAPTACMEVESNIRYLEQHAPAMPTVSSREDTSVVERRRQLHPYSATSKERAEAILSRHDDLSTHPNSLQIDESAADDKSNWIPLQDEDMVEEGNTHQNATRCESSKLKGIIWPGMDLFDTADEDSKKKRNQKKNNSTLMQMEAESDLVEQTEMIYYYPSWELKQARFITGEVESSPPRELTPKPKATRTRKPRAPLGKLDANIPDGNRGKRSWYSSTHSSKDNDANGGRHVRDHHGSNEVNTTVKTGDRLRNQGHDFMLAQGVANRVGSSAESRGTYGSGRDIGNLSHKEQATFGSAYGTWQDSAEGTQLLNPADCGRWLRSADTCPQGVKNSTLRTSLRRNEQAQNEHRPGGAGINSPRCNQQFPIGEWNQYPFTQGIISPHMDFTFAQGSTAERQSDNPLSANFAHTLQSHDVRQMNLYKDFGQQLGPLNCPGNKLVRADLGREATNDTSGDETVDQDEDDRSLYFE